MKKSRFTEAQIVSILNEWDAGTAVAELSRRHGVHANTLRLWRSKYGGLEVSELAKAQAVRRRDDANAPDRCDPSARDRRDERADLKKRLGPSQRKEAVKALQELGLSERAACRLVRCPRRTMQYRSRRTASDDVLRAALRKLA